MNRGSFLKKLAIGLAAVMGAPYLPKLSQSVNKLQSINIADANYISGFLKMSNQMLNDIPAFMAWLENKLPEILLNHER